MPRKANPWGKTVEPNHAHAVYQSSDGFTYFVLRSYKHPDSVDPYARWYLMTVSPMTPTGEMGDGYAAAIKRENDKVIDNTDRREIRFHIHAERLGQDQSVICFDLWEPTLKLAYMQYVEAKQRYPYVTLVAELDESALSHESEESPRQTATLFTSGSPVAHSFPHIHTDEQTRGGDSDEK